MVKHKNSCLIITYIINFAFTIYAFVSLSLLQNSNVPEVWITLSFIAKQIILLINAIQLYNSFKYNSNYLIGLSLTMFALFCASRYSYIKLIISVLFLLLSLLAYKYSIKRWNLRIKSIIKKKKPQNHLATPFSMNRFKNRITLIRDGFSFVNIFILWCILPFIITGLSIPDNNKNLILYYILIIAYAMQITLNVKTKYMNYNIGRYIFLFLYVYLIVVLLRFAPNPNNISARSFQFLSTIATLDILIRSISLIFEVSLFNSKRFSSILPITMSVLSLLPFSIIFLALNQDLFFSVLVILIGILKILFDNKFREYLGYSRKKKPTLYLLLATVYGILLTAVKAIFSFTSVKKIIKIYVLQKDFILFFQGRQLLPVFYTDALYILSYVCILCILLTIILIAAWFIGFKHKNETIKEALKRAKTLLKTKWLNLD